MNTPSGIDFGRPRRFFVSGEQLVTTFAKLDLIKYESQLRASSITPKAAKINGLEASKEGLYFPYCDIHGRWTDYGRTRLDESASGKYKQPQGTGCMLYIPRNNRNRFKLLERTTRIVVVEGEKKAICVAETLIDEWAVVGIGGVNSFWAGKRSEREGHKPIYTVFEAAGIPWFHERHMYVCFDSDKSTNIRVREAEAVLLQALRERGCVIYSVDVPVSDLGQRQGADDWITAKGTGEFLDEVFMARPKILAGVARPLNIPEPIVATSMPEPPKFLVYPSVQVGANLWFGMPETMKSLTRNQLLVDLLNHKPRVFSDESPWEIRWDNPPSILIICSEEPVEEFTSGFWRCARGNGLRDQEIRRMLAKLKFYSAPEYDLRLDRIIDAWDVSGRPKLVFADHLLGLMPRKNFAGKEVNAIADPQIITDTFLQVRMLFAREGVAFVCIAHTAKKNEGIFGSINWEASTDTITKFHRSTKTETDPLNPTIVLEPWKRRHSVREKSFKLTGMFSASEGANYKMEYSGESETPSESTSNDRAQEREEADNELVSSLLAYLRDNPGSTYADLTQAFPGYTDRKIRLLCTRLATNGILTSTQLRREPRQWSVVVST